MRSFESSRQYQEDDTIRRQSSMRLYGNMVLCLAVIFFSLFGINWILSDISGVYVVSNPKVRMRSPVILSLVRSPTRLEGELSLSAGERLILTDSSKTKGEQLHLTFSTPDSENRDSKLIVNLDGNLKDEKIDAVLSSGGRSLKLQLDRDGSASVMKIMQSQLYPIAIALALGGGVMMVFRQMRMKNRDR